jgi:hypothetical protein
MALQLKNKVKEEKPESEKKKSGKYKRKRNVFGKRTTRFGLYGLIIGLIAIFAIVKVVCTINQNNKQKKIEKKLSETNALIEETRRKLAKKQVSYDNVGKLISTLPTTFDKQAISIDLNRIVVLSQLEESKQIKRSITPVDSCPIKSSVSTVKAVAINMVLYGDLYNYDSFISFVDFITQYNHEYFYYVQEIKYLEDKAVHNKCEIQIKMYTFYNDVSLSTSTTNTTTTTTA